MPVPRPLLLTIVSAATTLGLLTLGAPATASAAVAPTTSPSGAQATYRPAPTSGVTAAAVSPSGCIQRADYPHKSTHVPGTMNGVVRTVCLVYVRRISESAQMWE